MTKSTPDITETPTPDEAVQELVASARQYLGSDSEAPIRKAYQFAAKAHSGQIRKSGEPYITHPIAVAQILTDLHLDLDSIIAAILHDVVEDTSVTVDEIKKEFGEQIASLVDGLTKIGKVSFRSNQEKLAENFRKMILAMAKDLRVIIIKLADRLHNMRTISHMPEIKAKRIAQETLDIYAPLANRLGIYEIKSELEDSCLRVLKKEIYDDLRQKIAQKRQERKAYIDEVVSILKEELTKYGFKNFEVYGRPKHFYSIYKKMVARKIDFEDIHDLFAFRIIVDSIKDCYEALGIVHAMWKPMPGRFKDYIAMPKANMYQSLHTTVVRPSGEPAEIQIRTWDMHHVCEYGIAAHWAYKEAQDKTPSHNELQRFSWLRQIMEWQKELKDPNEFLEAVKVDLFDEEIFVFTPRGDVISLPQGATALDFAFAVHTDVGNHTIGVKINSTIAPIKKKLKSGDIVEVLTSPQQKPSKDWLNWVVTSKAKNKIRASLRKEEREKSRELGHDLLQQALQNLKPPLSIQKLTSQDKERITKLCKESKFEDTLISIGYGKYDAETIVKKLFEKTEETASSLTPSRESKSTLPLTTSALPRSSETSQGILVSGIRNVVVNFARCCHPLPGEDIMGFITRGRGVTIHRADCQKALDLDPHRRIDVSWDKNTPKRRHSTFIQVITKDRPGVLAEVTQAISACGGNIQKADIRVGPNSLGHLDFELGIVDLQQLENIIHKIEAIPAVVAVERRNVLQSSKQSTKKAQGNKTGGTPK